MNKQEKIALQSLIAMVDGGMLFSTAMNVIKDNHGLSAQQKERIRVEYNRRISASPLTEGRAVLTIDQNTSTEYLRTSLETMESNGGLDNINSARDMDAISAELQRRSISTYFERKSQQLFRERCSAALRSDCKTVDYLWNEIELLQNSALRK